jgi:hypothetical protein
MNRIFLQKKSKEKPILSNPWQSNFIDKILLISKKEQFKSKNKEYFKNFSLASLSIDTGAKIYAQKVDALHKFALGFLKGFKEKKKPKL